MSSTQIAIRTDPETKEGIANFAKSIGLSTGAFMIAAARESMKNKSVTLTPQYDPAFVARIAKARAEHNHHNSNGPFSDDEAVEFLDNLMSK